MGLSAMCSALLVSAILSTAVVSSPPAAAPAADFTPVVAAVAALATLGLVVHLPQGCKVGDASLLACGMLAGLLVVCSAWLMVKSSVHASQLYAEKQRRAQRYTRSVVNAVLQGVTLALAMAYLLATQSNAVVFGSAVIACLSVSVTSFFTTFYTTVS